MAHELLDELADLVATRLERRRAAPADTHLNPATSVPKWTDRLANTLREIRLRRLTSHEDEHMVGNQPER